MTKHRRTRTRRKSQRGGDWYNPISWFGSSESTEVTSQPSGLSGAIDSVTGTTGALVSGTEDLLQQAKEKSGSLLSSLNPFSSSQEVPATQVTEYNAVGGRRRRKTRRNLRGGKGGLGLTYYATPVSGLKVADPTTWLKGGSRRRRRSRKVRRHR